jgi:DNA-binding protein H-NS
MECENPNHFGTYIDNRDVLRCSARDCWIKQLPPKHVRDRIAQERKDAEEAKALHQQREHEYQMAREFPAQAESDAAQGVDNSKL